MTSRMMYQAIKTKFIGPSNTKGSRVKAWSESGISLTKNWDHALDSAENHVRIAQMLAEKMGWAGHWYGGAISGSGCAFVRATNGQSDFLVIGDEAKAA